MSYLPHAALKNLIGFKLLKVSCEADLIIVKYLIQSDGSFECSFSTGVFLPIQQWREN